MSFEILQKDPTSKARLGPLRTPHGEIHTPAFVPIGTKGAVKTLATEELVAAGAEVILANTYHLWISGDETIARAGGLHKFMHWDRPIMTDSGGFQLFSLGEKNAPASADAPPLKIKKGLGGVVVSEEGVLFRDEISGAEHFLTPEKSVEIQNNLGSDIQVVLDEFTGDISNYAKVKATVERTRRWATRARHEFQKLNILPYGRKIKRLQNGVVQGGMFDDLRKQSAEDLAKLDFEGYCIGGVAVGGESSEEQYKAVEMSVPYLPDDKPRHLLGVGTPDQIIEAVRRGIDTFDCVIPTREARHGRAYVQNQKSNLKNQNFEYDTLQISKSEYKESFEPLDKFCDCETCAKYSKAYLHHLFKSGEMLGLRLMTIHNVRFFLRLMEKIRADML